MTLGLGTWRGHYAIGPYRPRLDSVPERARDAFPTHRVPEIAMDRMTDEQARAFLEEFGRRSWVEGELVVRVRPTRIHGFRRVAG
jgi:hypothetical protein